MKTEKFTATMGVNTGYFHSNSVTPLEYSSGVWQKIAQEVYESTTCYVSAVLSDSITVYSEGWGCPKGGEQTFSITGERNPVYFQNSELYKECVLNVLEKVSKHFAQSTTQVSFQEVDFHYIDNR